MLRKLAAATNAPAMGPRINATWPATFGRQGGLLPARTVSMALDVAISWLLPSEFLSATGTTASHLDGNLRPLAMITLPRPNYPCGIHLCEPRVYWAQAATGFHFPSCDANLLTRSRGGA